MAQRSSNGGNDDRVALSLGGEGWSRGERRREGMAGDRSEISRSRLVAAGGYLVALVTQKGVTNMALKSGSGRHPAEASTGGDRSLPVLENRRLDLQRALEDLLRCPNWGMCFSRTCLCPAFLLLLRRYLRKHFPTLRRDEAHLEEILWHVQKRFRSSSTPIKSVLGFAVTVVKRIIIDEARHASVVRRSEERMLSNKKKALASGIQPAVHHIPTDAQDLLAWLEPQVEPGAWKAMSLTLGERRSSREVGALMKLSHTRVQELVEAGLKRCRRLTAKLDSGSDLTWICA